MKYRNVNRESIASFSNALGEHDFSNIGLNEDVDTAVRRLDEIIMYHFNECCPIINKQVSFKDYSKPWIDHSLKSDIKRRHNMLLLKRSGKLTPAAFNRYRNFVTTKLRYAKKTYFHNKFNSIKCDMYKTWSVINSIIRPSSKSKNNVINKIVKDGVSYTNQDDVCNVLNDYFADIGKYINESVPSANFSHSHFLSGNYRNSFYFSPLAPEDVKKIIHSLKNKPCTLDCYSSSLLKVCSEILSPVICKLINMSISSGVFPSLLKKAKVIPLHKGGDSTICSNYRPISILHILSKIFEKAAHIQLVKYLESNNILCNEQFGFRRNCTTTNATMQLLTYLYRELDNGNYVFSLFIDFKKAFDSVNHNILLSKLYHYGIRGLPLLWFKSYLCNRTQYIRLQDGISGVKNITTGVPQGSILGPTLFLLFINDIVNVSDKFKYILYADDSNLMYSFNKTSLNHTIDTINNELLQLDNWLIANKLILNIDKTKFTIFSYRSNVVLEGIKIKDNVIGYTRETKFLGIYLDNNLTFTNHCNFVCSKVSRSVGVLFRLNYFLPLFILRSLYFSLIHPYFMYGLEIYFNSTVSNKNKILTCQKRAIRLIHKVNYNFHTNSLFKNSKILKISDLHSFQCLIYMYKALYLDGDSDLEALSKNSDNHSHNTRNSFKLIVPYFKKAKSQQSILYIAVNLWNNLPIEIAANENIDSFKCKLRKYFIDAY